MFQKKANKKAIASFVIFCIILVKDILVSDLKLIPVRSPENRLISWFFILPITMIAIAFSIQIIKIKYLERGSANNRFFDINLLLALPVLLYIIYVFFIG